jgi:hypothetical protein
MMMVYIVEQKIIVHLSSRDEGDPLKPNILVYFPLSHKKYPVFLQRTRFKCVFQSFSCRL